MTHEGVIYALSLDGETFRYVGLSKNLEQRLFTHKSNVVRGSSLPVHNWIRKHGFNNVVVTVLDEQPLAVLPQAEIRWIAELRQAGFNLLNLTDGGEGTFGWSPSEETRQRMAAARRGKTMTLKNREALRQAHLGAVRSEETKELMRIAATGRKDSPETTEKRRIASTGRKHSPETLKKMSAAQTARASEISAAVVRYNKTRVITDETRKRMSEAAKKRVRKPLTDEQRAAQSARVSAANKTRVISEETRRKMSEAAKLRHQKAREQKELS